MAREYPRFLFSDPKNTKSKGPFVVHTLHPRLLFRIIKTAIFDQEIPDSKLEFSRDDFKLLLLDNWDSASEEDIRLVKSDMREWLNSQIKQRSIAL